MPGCLNDFHSHRGGVTIGVSIVNWRMKMGRASPRRRAESETMRCVALRCVVLCCQFV